VRGVGGRGGRGEGVEEGWGERGRGRGKGVEGVEGGCHGVSGRWARLGIGRVKGGEEGGPVTTRPRGIGA